MSIHTQAETKYEILKAAHDATETTEATEATETTEATEATETTEPTEQTEATEATEATRSKATYIYAFATKSTIYVGDTTRVFYSISMELVRQHSSPATQRLPQ